MDKALRLQVIMSALDKASAPLRAVDRAAKEMVEGIAKSRKELRDLDRVQKDMRSFRKLKGDLDKTERAMEENQRTVSRLAREIDKVDRPTKEMSRAFEKAKRDGAALKREHADQRQKLEGLRRGLDKAGYSSRRFGDSERKLRDDIDRTSRAMKDQERRAEKLADVRRRSQRMQETGSRMRSAGGRATLGVTAPIVGLGGMAVGASNEFDKQMANVATLTDANIENMDRMGEKVREISKRVPVELELLPDALYDIRSAGVDASKAMDMLEHSTRLAVAGRGSPQEAVALVTGAVNAFNLEGEEADRVYDNVFKVIKSGVTTISGLSQGFGAVAGTIAASGTKLDEYLASIAALTTSTRPASVAHTQMRAVINGLTRDSEQTRKVFGALGAKDLPELIRQSGGLVPALRKINDELGGNQTAIQGLLGSAEASDAFGSLTSSRASAFDATLDDMRNGANAVDAAFDKQSATDLAKRAQNLNKLKNAAIEMGASMAPALATAFGILGDVAERFSNLSPAMQKFIIMTLGIAAAIGPLLIGFGALLTVGGKLLPMFVRVEKGARVAGPAVRLLAAGFGILHTAVLFLAGGIAKASALLLANPVVLIIVGIIAAIGLMAYFVYKHWDAIVAFVATKWAQFKDLFMRGLAFVLGLRARFNQAGADLISGLIAGFMGKVGALKNRIVETASNVKDWFAKTLGIRSPSRVFMSLGGDVIAGLDRGLDRARRAPLDRIRGLARDMTAALVAGSATPALATAGGAGAGIPQAASAASPFAGATFNFNISSTPGQSADDVGRAVRAEIERLMRDWEARNRSSYRDDL